MVTRAQDIPKTIIYMNEIKYIQATVKLIWRWMNELEYPPEAQKWVQPYFSIMAKDDKRRISQEFAKLDEDCSSCRNIIATDAYGLGIDNPDVRRVVQWLLPPTMSALYQRMGRAMECGRGSAVYTLLYPAWCIGCISGCPESRGNKKKDFIDLRSFSKFWWCYVPVNRGSQLPYVHCLSFSDHSAMGA
jgi:Helicase conserved C-terminal domain